MNSRIELKQKIKIQKNNINNLILYFKMGLIEKNSKLIILFGLNLNKFIIVQMR